jgi:hypothetical protein
MLKNEEKVGIESLSTKNSKVGRSGIRQNRQYLKLNEERTKAEEKEDPR